ncbi:MAG: dihydroneopterin triphosphate diphosphatase [Glaciecola sp.]
MTTAYKRPESVLVVLYNEHQQVLVLQRDDDPYFWQSVTGSLEDDETPIQTARREVLEETNINLYHHPLSVIDCRLTNQYHIRPDWQSRYAPGVNVNHEYVFCAQVSRAVDIKLTEHLQYLWLAKQDAIDKVWSPSNKAAIDKYVPQRQLCKSS